jgi:hypothetical protein
LLTAHEQPLRGCVDTLQEIGNKLVFLLKDMYLNIIMDALDPKMGHTWTRAWY